MADPTNHPPSLPVPPPMLGSDPDSWANSTITVRLPAIARRVQADNELSEHAEANLQALVDDLPHGVIRPLTDVEAADYEIWDAWISSYANQHWLDIPWFFSETYFYRRILEATGYFQAGEGEAHDPFRVEKVRGLKQAGTQIRKLADHLYRLGQSNRSRQEIVSQILELSLWGNQADLSLWPAVDKSGGEKRGNTPAFSRMIIDQRPLLFGDPTDSKHPIWGWVTDNAGLELATDLMVINFLIKMRIISRLRIFVKSHPTFVSDATLSDFEYTLRILSESTADEVAASGNMLLQAYGDGTIEIIEDRFWTSPRDGWEMPPDTRSLLRDMDLTVVKGDMNYRRLLGDRHWDYSTPFERIVDYFPSPVLSLRVLKAELASGITKEKIELLEHADPRWLTSGQWGTIQFADPTNY